METDFNTAYTILVIGIIIAGIIISKTDLLTHK